MKTQKKTILKIITMYGATALGSVIGLLISILNTRILGTEHYGDLKFVETVIRFTTSLVTAGFFLSITRLLALSDDKEYQRRMLGYFVIILLVMGAIGSCLVLGFSFLEPIFFDNGLSSIFRRYFFILVIFLASVSLVDILRGLNHVYTIAIASIATGLVYLGIAYPLSIHTIMDLESILQIYYGLMLLFVIVVIYLLKPKFNYGKQIVKQVYRENRTNGRPIYYGSLAGVATGHIAGFAISYYIDNTQLGFYMLAVTICSPLLTIPSVLGTIFYKRFANTDKIPSKVFKFSLLITSFVLLVFYLLIEEIIVFFYSENFLPSAQIAKVLIVAFLFHGLGDLINRFLSANGKGKSLRNGAFMVGAINVLGYTTLTYSFGINGTIFTKIFASASYFIIMLIYYRSFIKKRK